MDKGLALFSWVVICPAFTCFNLPFIIANLIFANDDACTLDPNTGMPFTLKTWLEVDGYLRLAMIALLIVIAIIACIDEKYIVKMFVGYIIVLIIYSLFELAWLIIGALMFWGNLS